MASDDRVALCVARFYVEFADALEQGAREALGEAGITRILQPGRILQQHHGMFHTCAVYNFIAHRTKNSLLLVLTVQPQKYGPKSQ